MALLQIGSVVRFIYGESQRIGRVMSISQDNGQAPALDAAQFDEGTNRNGDVSRYVIAYRHPEDTGESIVKNIYVRDIGIIWYYGQFGFLSNDSLELLRLDLANLRYDTYDVAMMVYRLPQPKITFTNTTNNSNTVNTGTGLYTQIQGREYRPIRGEPGFGFVGFDPTDRVNVDIPTPVPPPLPNNQNIREFLPHISITELSDNEPLSRFHFTIQEIHDQTHPDYRANWHMVSHEINDPFNQQSTERIRVSPVIFTDGSYGFVDANGIKYVNAFQHDDIRQAVYRNGDYGIAWCTQFQYDMRYLQREPLRFQSTSTSSKPCKSKKKLHRKRPIPEVKDEKYYRGAEFIA